MTHSKLHQIQEFLFEKQLESTLEKLSTKSPSEWFARTQIEPFFRTVKHILKIQEAKSQTKFEMDIKIGRFFRLALDAQFFTKYVRKDCKVLKRSGFKQIIKHIIFNLNKFNEIEELIK